ncbi:hypothetical protein [Cupriavidus pampae]|uniref:Uncharacterized protein n=1 Tax=Cupriavidus pampae TaxID=659251 RepID=A0ABM8WUG3_9BURK|nr:hypothetical protein [Cupriavidus pampae]CAG9171142.1 hypothetical protein LMG32289_02262 [Cupriavidus pampae]
MKTLALEDVDIKLFRSIRNDAEDGQPIEASGDVDKNKGSSVQDLLEDEYVDWLNELVAEGRGRHVPRRH